jgi:TonB family protein
MVLHSCLIALLVWVTRAVVAPPRPDAPDTTLIYLPRVRPLETPAAPRPPAQRGNGGQGGGGVLVMAAPPPKGFQTVIAPTVIPTDIPPVNLREIPTDPRNYTGIGVEGGVAAGVSGGTGPVDLRMLNGVEGLVFAEATPDIAYRKAEVLSQPRPRFPSALQQAGIEGGVTLRFVIDTLGLVDPGSIVTIEEAHPLLGQAAMEALTQSRFTPARYGNRRVRQLTIQKFSFRLQVR